MYEFLEKSQKKKKETRPQQPVIQRKIFVDSYSKKEVKIPSYQLMVDNKIKKLLESANKKPVFNRLFNHFAEDSENRHFTNWAALANFMKKQVNLAFDAESLSNEKNADSWFQNPFAQGVIELNHDDPAFISISNAVMQNLRDKPYKTDAKHEVVPSSPSPNIRITRIQMIKNPRLLQQYEAAREELKNRKALNEAHLFAGFREEIADKIATNGHRPDLGAYVGGRFKKGHGALGRGAYFTDTAAKAISYSRGPNKKDKPQTRQNPGDGTEHSFFLQDVLLGNVLYGNDFPFRHSHLDEMVRTKRGHQKAPNFMRKEGKNTGDVNGQSIKEFDSIVSAKTHEPGGGQMNILDRAINGSFDSNEYLVRNADQIYVKFRIYYTLEPGRVEGLYPKGYPLTSIEDIQVQKSAVHLPKSWLLQEQGTIGSPQILIGGEEEEEE